MIPGLLPLPSRRSVPESANGPAPCDGADAPQGTSRGSRDFETVPALPLSSRAKPRDLSSSDPPHDDASSPEARSQANIGEISRQARNDKWGGSCPQGAFLSI